MTQTLHILDDGRGVTQVDGIQETIRVGRTVGFSRSRIVDSHNPSRLIAISEGTCVSLGPAPPGFEAVDNPMLDIVDSPSLPPLHRVFGARRRDDGFWVLPPLTAETASPDAALHLGPIQIVLETAATELAERCAGTEALQIKSWHVMYTARGKVGPFRASGEAFMAHDGGIGCFLSLHDEGNEDRVVASASCAFVRRG
jgi:hypothetical protein